MAIATYADLTASIAVWMARDDLTAIIPDLITLFEAAAARKLGVRQQETTATLTPVSGAAALPADYLGYKTVTWLGSAYRVLEYATPAWITAAFPTSPAGTPSHFTIVASSLRVRPVDDTNIELVYFARDAAVVGSLNWLFTKYPDAYVFGTLCEGYALDHDEERAAFWKARRDEVFDEIIRTGIREGAGLAIKPAGPIV